MATPTIFLIDDHASVRSALSEMLGVFGYAVKAYESADVYLATMDEREPGCIVADARPIVFDLSQTDELTLSGSVTDLTGTYTITMNRVVR